MASFHIAVLNCLLEPRPIPMGLVPHPGGMRDNTPMFQHWGKSAKWWSAPKGRLRDRAPFQQSPRDSSVSANARSETNLNLEIRKLSRARSCSAFGVLSAFGFRSPRHAEPL